MLVPIGIAGILIDKHIVNEGVDVEQRVGQLLVGFLWRDVRATATYHLRCLYHQVPGFEVTLRGFYVVAAVFL